MYSLTYSKSKKSSGKGGIGIPVIELAKEITSARLR
jgi:hypothetical protein